MGDLGQGPANVHINVRLLPGGGGGNTNVME